MSDLQNAITGLIGDGMSMKDLLKEVKDICKDLKDQQKKKSKSDAKDGVTKPLNSYQLFVKEQMKVLKDNGTTLTGKDLMKEIGVLWKQKKGTTSPTEEDDAHTAPEDGEDSEPEPEPEPVKPVGKKFADSKKPSVGGFAGAKGGGSLLGKKGK